MMSRLAVLSAVFGFCYSLQIQNLPGQPNANFKQYSGYYSVGSDGNHQLHYWFIESQSNPSTDPVLLWLTGGPGCSGLSALLTEWGPFFVNADGATLRANPYGWNRNASVLVLESPAGVGFSWSKSGDVSTGDDQTASENWDALKAFFTEFSQYQKNDFYVTGESYGGIYVPTLVQTILDRQSQFQINIKGFAIGNGLVDEDLGTDSIIQFLHKHGLIDQLTWQKIQQQCCPNANTDDCPYHSFTKQDQCGNFVNNAANTAWGGGLNPYNMYQDCTNQGQIPKRFALDFKKRMGRLPKPEELGTVPCMNETAVTVYLNRRDVRSVLGIPGMLPDWSICNDDLNENYNRQYATVGPQVKNAITAGLKVMLYYGDIDMACNFFMGQRFAANLGLKQVAAKKSYHVDGQVAGFVTDWGQLKFVTVKGAGHMVPTDKPSVAFHILDSFLNNKKF
ncbi:unnamed protein product, partial [Mesorhabditis belari]|uniref:Carboxypeptidase n=1 Tax=Mesorhabditis belari TaxID=2138241 RepID=A0AAF3EVA7_9BILA